MTRRKNLWNTIRACALRIPYKNQPEYIRKTDLSCTGLKNWNSFFDFDREPAKTEAEQRMAANGSPFFRKSLALHY